MLLRHAKSDWTRAGARDHERTLAPRGREAAPRIGAYMAHHGLMPELVLCSTATRARETWDLVAKAFTIKPVLLYEVRIYEADPNALFDVVKESKSDVHALLL
ncbi:MAG TPA: histidine phosphatase family protein, partial [Candidatus Cybelea sp.]|nr:histidine phosphatase family protein [Candidatus Cybelea sp.]